MMNPTTKLLEVNLGDRSYPIRIGRHLDSDLSQFVTELIAEGRKGVAVIDQNFLEAQPGFAEAVFNQLPYLTIESGEASKSVDQIARVWNFLASSKVDRSGFLLAVGGGVVGDMAGFAAASFLRGISFHQGGGIIIVADHVPTLVFIFPIIVGDYSDCGYFRLDFTSNSYAFILLSDPQFSELKVGHFF